MYVLQCSDGTMYCGITTDIKRRLDEHNFSARGAKYTRSRRPVSLIHTETCSTRSDALKREYRFKSLDRKKKLSYLKTTGLLLRLNQLASLPRGGVMNVLVLAGEIGKTRPFSYGLDPNWSVRIEDVVGQDLLALSQKFEGSSIPCEELSSVIHRARIHVSDLIDQLDPAVIVATGFAATVLMIMRSKRDWIGPVIVINPMGPSRQSLERDGRLKLKDSLAVNPSGLVNNCIWIGDSSSVKNLAKLRIESALNMTVIQHDDIDSLYRSGMLTGCVHLVAQA